MVYKIPTASALQLKQRSVQDVLI